MPKREREEYFEQKVKSIGEKIQDLEEQRKFVRHIEKYGNVPELSNRDGELHTYKEQIKCIMKEREK